MQFLWKRYTRSGYASPWFYALLGSAFVSLTVLAIVRRDWLIAVLAFVMVLVTVAGSRVMRRLGEAAQASQRAIDERKDEDDG